MLGSLGGNAVAVVATESEVGRGSAHRTISLPDWRRAAPLLGPPSMCGMRFWVRLHRGILTCAATALARSAVVTTPLSTSRLATLPTSAFNSASSADKSPAARP